jgi:taurine dioxygenase
MAAADCADDRRRRLRTAAVASTLGAGTTGAGTTPGARTAPAVPATPAKQRRAGNMLNVRKVGGSVGAEATGVDVGRPVDEAARRQLSAALVEHGVLIVRDPHFDARQFLAAGSLFGEPMPIDYANPLPDLPLVQRLSSHARNANGSVQRIGPRWHTDQADHPLPPKFTALYAIELFRTGGGTTGFANLRAAYEALSDDMRRSIDGLQAIYLARRRRSRRPRRR